MRVRRLHKLLLTMACLFMYTLYRVTIDTYDRATRNSNSHQTNGDSVGNGLQPEPPPDLIADFAEVKGVQDPPVVESAHNAPIVGNPVNVKVNRTGQAEQIHQFILGVNSREDIHNLHQFSSRSDASVVILVMVHKRIEYLRFLINSLRKVRYIEDALLIFSHDYFSEEANELVKTVDFCQTMQIFYPYLLQIYENEFPGQDPNDCPRDVKRDKAKQTHCNNWEHPDRYGHYREVKYVMTKHHWFWKLQHVFGSLGATKNHTGLVLLLEEDHYLNPDSYFMLQKMYDLKKTKCPECDILTLGTYEKSRRYKDRADMVDVLQWYSSRHNMGMAMDRNTWQRLQPCVKEFCKYDDYNWDWTLQFISTACLKPALMVMVPKAPRIFHIGECSGIHHTKGKCNAEELVHRLNEVVANSAEYLFPEMIKITPLSRAPYKKIPKANGGWGDVRDHALCMAYGRQHSAQPVL